MKNCFVLALLLLMQTTLFAQSDRRQPYEKNLSLPAFFILETDSSTIFNTYNIEEGKPAILFYFSPDCEHCHITCKELLASMDSMKNADFYFATFAPISLLKPFEEEYHLHNYPNIRVVGKDYQYFFPPYFAITTVPCVVVYDRKKQMVKRFADAIRIPELMEALKVADNRK